MGLRTFQRHDEGMHNALYKLSKQVDPLLNSIPEFVDHVYVAVGPKDQSCALEYINSRGDSRVMAFKPKSWGHSVPQLNEIVQQATTDHCDLLWFRSWRINLPDGAVERMLSCFRNNMLSCFRNKTALAKNVLVVGSVVPEGHNFTPGFINGANGSQVPFNTNAIWNLEWLKSTHGFLRLSEEMEGAKGIEEFALIALLQYRYSNLRVMLLNFEGVSDHKEHWDEARRVEHDKMVATKIERAEAQRTELHVLRPRVEHISVSN